MPIRPELEQKLPAGFQRHVDQQDRRSAVRLSNAEQMAALFGCGEVVGVYSGKIGGRKIWLYAFSDGFLLLDSRQPGSTPMRWKQITDLSEIWTDVYDMNAEDYRPTLTAYRLKSPDGQADEGTPPRQVHQRNYTWTNART